MKPSDSHIVATSQGLKISGDAVFSTVSELLKSSQTILNKHALKVLEIDCGELGKIDSAGIALLIEWKRWCFSHQKKMAISDLPAQALSLIRANKIEKIFVNH